MNMADPVAVLAVLALAGPALLLAVLGGASLLDRPVPERANGRLARWAMTLSFVSSAAALVLQLGAETSARVLSFGTWFSAGEGSFSVDLLIDPASLGFATVIAAISGIVAAFSNRYLHREPGYNRYFVLFAAFVSGMLLVALAGSIEVLFAGWELLGISSALLVAFFHDRPTPVRNALRVFAAYRFSDAAMLAAAVLLHHQAGGGSLALLFGAAGDVAPLAPDDALAIGSLLVVAVAVKCALLPFSGWLPRAMEGPTPSSAVYYGALSIHAGCFLLLRAAPLLEQSLVVRLMAGAAGVGTALYATVTARVHPDIKSTLALASLTQVGVIVVEIAAGFYLLAYLHMLGHACLRLLQFLSAPNLLHDHHELQNAVGELSPTGGYLDRAIPARARTWLYRLALERGYLDALLDRFLVAPFLRMARAADRFDRRLCSLVSGGRSSRASLPPPSERPARD